MNQLTALKAMRAPGGALEPEAAAPESKVGAETAPLTERERLLRAAIDCVCHDRNSQYGEPEDNFRQVAAYWSEYLHASVSADDVAVMMALFKIARIMTGAGKADSYIDACGYLACAGEIARRSDEAIG